MEERQRPRPGEFYRHFKDKLYQIIAVASHSETGEEMVVYQALYGEFSVFVRPLTMFLSETDKEKYPEVVQKWRFELVEHTGQAASGEAKSEVKTAVIPENTSVEQEDSVGAELMQFLEARSCKEKLNILLGAENHLTEAMLLNMMVSMDLPVTEGTGEEHFEILKDYLQTRIRFETSRLR